MKSRAAVLYKFNEKFTIEEIEVKEVKGEAVLIRILGAGV